MTDNVRQTGIGAAVRRREDLRLLTGNGRYSDDVTLSGQAYAFMLRSPHAHARVRGIATAAARTASGVLAVLTGQDLLADGLRPIPHAVWSNHPAEIALPDRVGAVTCAPPHHCMATEAVHQVGDIIAVVVATTLTAAKDAAELVQVEYEPLPAIARAADAVAPNAPHAHEDALTNLCVDSMVGDEAVTAAAFAGAAHVVRLDTWVQRVAGVPMEPRAAIGEYDRLTGKYTLHAGAGGVVRPRNDLAAVLGVPEADCRMVMHDVGGNFGTRGAFNPEFALVAWAARRVGRPVKWTGTRSEAFLSDYQARDLTATAELALAADGTFLAMRGSNLVNVGAYPVGFSPLQKGVAIVASIYHVPAVHFRARAALTNTAPTRPYRSAGRPEVMFVMERLIDLAARQTGLDRVALRRRNLVPESAMPYRNPFGMVYDSGAYHAVMERALVLGDWSGFAARRVEAKARGKLRGIGVANYVDTATGVPRERAEMTIKPEGVVELIIGTGSQGQGHETSFAQLVTEWLGVPNETVRLVTGDTDRVKWGGGAHSGRALRLGSIVMHNASREIIAKATRIAAHVLEVGAGRHRLRRRTFHRHRHRPQHHAVRGRRGGVSPATICRTTCTVRSTRSATKRSRKPAFPTAAMSARSRSIPTPAWCRIVNYVAVDDVGRAVNPMIVHGQVHGGIAQGVGQALWEQCVYDPRRRPGADAAPSWTTRCRAPMSCRPTSPK